MDGGGEVLRSESRMFVDQLENSLESRKCQKGGGVNHSGLVQNLSEENIMKPSLRYLSDISDIDNQIKVVSQSTSTPLPYELPNQQIGFDY